MELLQSCFSTFLSIKEEEEEQVLLELELEQLEQQQSDKSDNEIQESFSLLEI